MRFSNWLLGAMFVLPAGLLLSAGLTQALEAGDPTHGKQVFAKCLACHSLEAGVNKVGPSLHGLIGRASASIDSFTYSDAMKNAHVNWTPEVLDQYLTNPKKMVPGTKMAFPGLPKDKDRADVIAYLQQAAGTSQ
ncbi:MAG TPA: cytochrome c family protein [Dongiaceae bacterium]|jgi:cytochrome c|nr:cytochrome c family protein [Dongiaceae bacterium]